jgi:hypothetical protein
MTIPLKAFAIFRGIVVVVDPERVFLEANNYRIFATREVAANLGEEAIREFGVLDADGQLKSATTNNPLQRRPCSAVHVMTCEAVHGPAERQR